MQMTCSTGGTTSELSLGARERVIELREARFVSITGGALAISLDSFGMLDAKVVVNLLPKLSVSVDFVKHGNWI